MSYANPDNQTGSSPPEGAPQPVTSTPSLVRDLTTHVTVIIGHAQLLRRRTRHLSGMDAAVIDRSLAAIEAAARRTHDTLRSIESSSDSNQSQKDIDR